MNLLQKTYNSIIDSFSASSTETITANSLVKNAISQDLNQLKTNPKLKKINQAEYIQFGNNDDMPEILSVLLEKSTTHSGIIRKKAKMVAGMGFKTTSEDKKWKAFEQHAGGFGVDLYNLSSKAAFYYEKDGGFLLVVDTDTETNSPIKLEVRSHQTFRVAKPENGKVGGYVLRDVFKRITNKVFSNDEEILPAFNENEQQARYGLYVKNPYSTNSFYGTPNYMAAFDFIESDFEFGRTIKNSARNGFAPRLIATFIGRNMSDEMKETEAEKFKTNFQGADSENVVISFVRREEDKPQFDTLDVTNLDKTIDVMAKLNDSKILTAHNVTSPTLFGIMVAGKLGGTGNELYSAYELFRTTETLPNREVVLAGFQTVLEASAFKGIELEVEDIDMRFLIGQDGSTEEEIDKEVAGE